MYRFNKSTETEDLVITNKSPLEPKQKPKSDKMNSQVKILKGPRKAQTHDADLDAKDKGPIRLEAKILNYQSPSLLYVSLVHQQKVFNELFENVQKYYSKIKSQAKDDWKVEDRCCTICHQSQTWRRAVILEIKGDSAKVFYSDFACIETVTLSSLRHIPAEFSSIGDAAIICHLCGIIPAVGDEWPSLTKEFLKDLLDAYPRIFITKHGKFKGKSMPVELWVYHTVQGGALEANQSEWRCLNKKIIEQGLGVPDPAGMPVTTGNTDDNTFLNLKGSIQDYLQVEFQPLKPLKIKSESESNSSTPTDAHEETTEDEPHSSNTVFVSDWLPPEPLPDSEFTAIPTYIDNDGVIYLHDVSQQDTLDLIRKALDVRFQNPDPKAKFTKWVAGEPCIALYFLDNKFYRGRILEVNEETSTCQIHYIDYGNEEICSFVDLRKSIALHQIPTQAHKCILNRIHPIGKRWDRLTLDYIHKSIVEKQCFVKVVGEPIEDMVSIELKYNKLWINDHLVEFEMAKYSDGSKAVIQKFAPIPTKSGKKYEESITHESDSGPDFIIESEDNVASEQNSFNVKELEGKDWYEFMSEEEDKIRGNFVTFPRFNEHSFTCDITILNEMSKLELSVVHDDETAALYESMYTELQYKSGEMSPLNGIFENKACLSMFPDDGKWYRAIILEYSETKNKIKVKYIDYGNIDIVSLADVREISEEYIQLPPATVTAVLHGVEINSNIDIKLMLDSFTETFLDKGPFNAEIISNEEPYPRVELKDNEGRLVYQPLIDCEFFIKSHY